MDCEATSEKGRCEDHVSVQGADICLTAVIDGLEFLNDTVDVVKCVLDLVVCIYGWKFQL